MDLDATQRRLLQEALEAAFPTVKALARMVDYHLDINLEATADGNLKDIVYDLIKWARSEGGGTALDPRRIGREW